MHIRFELDHLKASPQIEEQYVTEVLSGKMRIFQKEFLAPDVETASKLLVNSKYFDVQEIVKSYFILNMLFKVEIESYNVYF